MSGQDDKQKQLPAPEELGNAEDLTAGQVGAVNATSAVSEMLHNAFGFGRFRIPGVGKSTDFEDHDLNVMRALVENTKPSHLEEAGTALLNASKAINDAADELRQNIKNAGEDWQGEAGTSFEQWGNNLATTTESFSSYVELASVQVSAAATGLSSVKSSMPPADTRPASKAIRPEKFTETQKTANSDEYAEAVKVEANRQEAINQMNRLASFYSVSATGLNALQSQEPTFEAMPNVGVPKPAPSYGEKRVGDGDGGGGSGSSGGTSSGHHSSTVAPAHVPDAGSASHVSPDGTKEIHGSITTPDRPVGTNIDSVGTLPSPSVDKPVITPPTVTGPAGGGNTNPIAPFPSGYSNSMSPRPTSAGGGNLGNRSPYSAQGRAGGTTSQGRGATNSPMGRSTSTGQAGGGRGGTTGGRSSATGRGISGGTPRANGSATGRSGLGNAGANRDGVSGGRPTSSTGAAGKNGQRVPRGTVVGGESSGGSRSGAGRVGQRGVFGAPNSESASAKSANGGRRVQGASEAVTGKPTGKGAGARSGRGGFSSGGSGLVRGSKNQKPGEPEEVEGSERPDYVVEDQETHLPDDPRRNQPPVIN
ncbi:WXG100 family type VII secretion target [Streptomyces sp. VRA16 Mangrove soil]|uniref:WXG100 family type VII secretion target n=1 Tax=Streptomyces sp. VRA16 Mangrove soil TaxID=2817434 RepID=UPI001A9F1343|nr:WXG100 family type VII secretion target [Streptomyces sp. VRA16 Mangrove soil]MBO1336043.1 hypothetical protein [Streptomyces sp. VRA16 Mangrove soil]